MDAMNRMMQAFTQALCMPITAFSEAMSRTAHDWQPDHFVPPCMPAPCEPKKVDACPPARSCDWGDDGWRCRDGGRDDDWDRCRPSDRWNGSDRSCDRCGRGRSECYCSRCDGCGHYRDECRCSRRRCDTVKLVEYAVVSVRRGGGDHRSFHGQKVITDCVDLDGFRNMVIAEYIDKHRDAAKDAKNLRVYTRVLDCWCKEDFDFEEDQVDALREIAKEIRKGQGDGKQGS